MYSSKPLIFTSASLHTDWHMGYVEYLRGDYGDGLATFTDADFALCLWSRRSVSAHFLLLNGVLVT
jgi:hypothetical protein